MLALGVVLAFSRWGGDSADPAPLALQEATATPAAELPALPPLGSLLGATPTATPPATSAPEPTPSPTPTPPPHLPPPSPRPGASVISREISSGPTDVPRVALTFDAGVTRPEFSAPILDTLRDRGVHATMFLTGQWMEANPDLVARMAAEGHEFGNHSYSHPDFVNLSAGAIAQEIRQTESILNGLTGMTSKPLLRPPYGSRDRRVVDVIEAEGYYDIYWSLDSGDWLDDATAQAVIQKTIRGTQNGTIIVMHITTESTMVGVGPIIDALRARGFELVTLTDLLRN